LDFVKPKSLTVLAVTNMCSTVG